MNEDDLLKRLREDVARDAVAVQPLRPPAIRALWLLGTCLVLGAFVVLGAGFRPDFDAVGAWASIGFSLVQITVSVALFVVSLRWSIPGMSGSVWTGVIAAAAALLVHLSFAGATLGRSALAPVAGAEWTIGVVCLATITLLGAAPMALGTVLLLRGLLSRWLAAFALAGFASGLAAEAIWRLHCPYSLWSHILPFHTGALGVAGLLAIMLALYVRRAGSPLSWSV